ncbi:CBO0543 family protein [Neobacillus sp. NRS-1170]|uniref:CBO0543 family protein n=1 Tax=Neobacillus sp. NRS-1170 TaxID=3233898 RepID=UPI003D26ECB1
MRGRGRRLHFTIGIILLLISLRWANWKEWQRYYPTMIYIVAMSLLYKLFALYQFHLWKFSSHDFFFNSHIAIHLCHTFIINPLYTIIYLSNFPEESFLKKCIYIIKWVAALLIVELFLLSFDHINYFHGWKLKWTIFFDFSMFSLLRIHFKKPLWGIFLSIIFTLFYLFVFGYLT